MNVFMAVALCGTTYMVKQFINKQALIHKIRTSLLEKGAYKSHIFKRGYIDCDTPVTPFFDFDFKEGDKAVYQRLRIDLGVKQINNSVEEITDIVPSFGKQGLNISVASRPVNKLNYFVDWTKHFSSFQFGSDITFDNLPVTITSLNKDAVCNFSKTQTFALSPNVLYKRAEKLNSEGKKIKEIIEKYNIPYDTEFVRITESVLSPCYVMVIGSKDCDTLDLDIKHVFNDTEETLNRIIEDDIMEKN